MDPDNLSGKNSDALLDAILQLSNLLGCPEPIPIVDFSLANTTALDLANLQILNANLRLFIFFIEGFFLVTTRILFLSKSSLAKPSESC